MISRTGVSTRKESVPVGAGMYRRPDPAAAIAPAADPFEAGLRAIARRLQQSVPDLTAREREWLHDLAREECRYPMPTVRKLNRVSRRSMNAEDREAFAELIRADSLPPAPTCVRTAFDLETAATGPADVEQRRLEQEPRDHATWTRCRDALTRQLAATRRALDAVLHLGWKTVA